MNEAENIKQLPKDWKWVKLGEVLSVSSGKGIKVNALQGGKYAVYGGNGLNGYHSEYLLEEPKLIIGRVGVKCGVMHITKPKSWVTDNALIVEPKKDAFDIQFLKLKLGFENLNKLSVSTAQPVISGSKIYAYEILLPPKPTQQAIVSKIEELFSELDKGIENLRKAQQQLKTYRQSVLKWAFEGKLTNENVTEGELPKGWKLTKLGEYIEDISSGKSYRCDERPPKHDEVGIVKVSSVTWGFFDEMESKTCFSKDFLNTKYLKKKGDFLFSRANTIEFIGACVIVNKVDKTLMLSDKILRFIFSKDVSNEYALYYLRSRKGRKQIETLSTGNQDSMRNIGQEKIKQIEFPYCPIKEQNNIVQEIESRLSVADKMEESITQSLQQAEALRQSILKKAFEGKLVINLQQ